MKNIYQNPYRIIGIIANATAREIQSRKGKIQAFARVNKPVDSEYDFSFLEPISRDEATINKAFSDIEQNANRLKHSLFWFVNVNTFDQMALEHLKNGDEAKAKEIWHKLTNGQGVTAKNFSAYNNIATLWLLSGEEMPKISAIQHKIKLIESDYFTDFVHLVADKTYTINTHKQIEVFINEFLKDNSVSTQNLLKNLEGYAYTYLLQKTTEEPIHKIEIAVEKCEEGRNNNKNNAYQLGKTLYANTQKPLTELKNILGIQDLKYQTMADSIAKELKQCAVDNWNNSNEEEIDLKNSLQLVSWAKNIAVSNALKDNIQKDMRILQGMKDRELKQAVEVLETIEKAYYNVPYGSSLNWDIVVDIIIEHISRSDIEKIKNSTNTQKIDEYRRLVEFIIDKMDYSYQKKKIAYICYWKTISTPQPIPIPRVNINTQSSKTSETQSIFDKYSEQIIWAGVILFLLILCSIFGWSGIITLIVILVAIGSIVYIWELLKGIYYFLKDGGWIILILLVLLVKMCS